jgi:DNA-binding CsgD family transcriptional regulator
MAVRRWTDTDNDQLWLMYQNGASNSEIATMLGRSVPSVNNRLTIEKRRNRLFSEQAPLSIIIS